MAPSIVYLPDGQTFTVTPVFAGLFFKSNELNTHPTPFPPGWTVVLHTRDDADDDPTSRVPSFSFPGSDGAEEDAKRPDSQKNSNKGHLHSWTKPTLRGDSLFISSISQPSNNDFKPAASPTRQIALMLWVTLYWYFHQPPPPIPPTAEESGMDTGAVSEEWRICIRRDGVFRGRNLLSKLERMGLVASDETAVGTTPHDAEYSTADMDSWAHTFVARTAFWQIPGRLFLFTLQPTRPNNGSYPNSPAGSRPGSPSPGPTGPTSTPIGAVGAMTTHLHHTGPFTSTSHLPTYWPPPPLRYVRTNGVRHPARPKAPGAGEVFYSRYIPSVGQYLSFRAASSSPSPVPYRGPRGPSAATPSGAPATHSHLLTLSDTSLLQMWLSIPRVQKFWGPYVPGFLTTALESSHSFPVIAMWDGVPFGYLEVYWAKEDGVGKHLPASEGGKAAGDFERGFHALVGEEWARGRVQSWVTSIMHWILAMDYRTMSVCIEPRIDNGVFIGHVEKAGFKKETEIQFPHKRAWFGRLSREEWAGPAL